MNQPISDALRYQLNKADPELKCANELKDYRDVNNRVYMALEFPLSPKARYPRSFNDNNYRKVVKNIYTVIEKKIIEYRIFDYRNAIRWYIDETDELNEALHMSFYEIANIKTEKGIKEFKKFLNKNSVNKVIKRLKDVMISNFRPLEIRIGFVGKSNGSLNIQVFYEDSYDEEFKKLSEALEELIKNELRNINSFKKRNEFINWNPRRTELTNGTYFKARRNVINIGRYRTKEKNEVGEVFNRQERELEGVLKEGKLLSDENFIIPGVFLTYSDQLFFDKGQDIRHYFPFKGK